MRNRRQHLDLQRYSHIAMSILLLSLLGLLIWFIPPTHILVILSASLLLGGSLYAGFFVRFGKRNAFLGASALTLTLFIYLLKMLDLVNAVILVCFLVSLGILMHQK